MTGVDQALRDPDPLALLALVSSVYSLTDPRECDPFDQADEPAIDRDTLLDSFLGIDNRQTTAMLHVLAVLTGDDVTVRRIRKELATRRHSLPGWLPELARTEVHRVVELAHVLGDGDDLLLDVRFPGGAEATVVVYVDHNLGTVVKDAFVVEQPVAAVLALMRDKVSDPDTTYRDVAPADARTRIADAIDLGARFYPPLVSDTWPACRPLVEWLVRQLPQGGRGYERPEWDDAATQRLRDEFFASPYGVELDDADRHDLLDSILWFGTEYGPGDPLRWSPVSVEMLLADWIPRKIVADAAYLSKAPDLLRAFIRFCHDRRGLRAALTAETLAAVDEWEPDYQQLIRSPRPQGAAAIVAAVQRAATGHDDYLGDDYDDYDDHDVGSFEEIMLESLDRAVGGRQALMDLDAVALPDEDFDWSGIPADIHAAVREVLDLCDACCAELLDVECRTACRRFLRRVAAGDPRVFRRAAKASTGAAAVCWVIAKANRIAGSYGSGLTVKELMAFFGVTSSSQRAGVFLRAAGIDDRQYGLTDLGTPDLLVSSRRADI
ncbi:MAG TPA: DUF6398 domain-containing protein, partial [Kribbellaceae bacterium]